MLRIRLRRTGQKHQPSYRVVVADKDAKRDGRFVEIVGHYNPRTEPVTFEVNEERVRYWIGQGAQPSETVHRLRRTGQKHQPSYRVVVADKDAKRDGRFVEIVGHYNPRTEPVTFEVNEERVRYWIGQGAQPSETVHRLLHRKGVIEAEPPKRATKPSRAEREAAEAAARAAAEERAAAAAAAEAAASADAEDGDDAETEDAG